MKDKVEDIKVEDMKIEEVVVDSTKLNLYQKMTKVRLELSQASLTKSGFNSFSKYHYFQTGDYLPTLTKLCDKYGLFWYDEVTEEFATMTVIDTEDLNTIPFVLTIPSCKVDVKGASEIQNLGGLLTYQRRYLLQTVFAISENDMLDASAGKDDSKKASKPEAPKADSPIAIMKTLCTEKSNAVGKEKVLTILDKVAKVKNPNMVKDEVTANKVIEALNEL